MSKAKECPNCGLMGNSGFVCGRCGTQIEIGLDEVFVDPIVDAGKGVALGASQAAGATVKLGATAAGQVGDQYREAGAVAAVGLMTVFQQGGAGMGFATLLSGYVGFVAAPSLIAMVSDSKLTVIVVSIFGLLCGGLLGMIIGMNVAGALRNSAKSMWFVLLPLLALSTWLTLRAPGALSAWWAQ